MKNKKETALKMIAAGYSVEEVMDIVGLEPEELYDILTEVLDSTSRVVKLTGTFEHFDSVLAGHFEMNIN